MNDDDHKQLAPSLAHLMLGTDQRTLEERAAAEGREYADARAATGIGGARICRPTIRTTSRHDRRACRTSAAAKERRRPGAGSSLTFGRTARAGS